MQKGINKKFLVSFIMLIILVMTLLTGKSYADEGTPKGRIINNWYVFNKDYKQSLNGGGWFYRYSCDWATYCSQNGRYLNDGSPLYSTNKDGYVASPDASLILSCIKNYSNENTYLNNYTLYDILTNEDEIDRYTELPDYSKGTGYGYIQYAWWNTDEGKSDVNDTTTTTTTTATTTILSKDKYSLNDGRMIKYNDITNAEEYNVKDDGSYYHVGNIKEPEDFNNLEGSIKSDLSSLLSLHHQFGDQNETIEKWFFVEENEGKYTIIDGYKNGCKVMFISSLDIHAYESVYLTGYISGNENEEIGPNAFGYTLYEGGNHLYTLAAAYEDFISNIAETDENGKFKYIDAGYQNSKTGLQFPKLKEDLNSCDTKNLKVLFNSAGNNYLIGPITINAATAEAEIGGNTYKFAEIRNFKVYTNLGQRDNWNFMYNNEIKGKDEVPKSGTEFYIVIPYEEGLTEITNISYEYRYLKAAAKYDLYIGDAQNQAYVLEAARWHETETVDVVPGPLPTYLEITKKAIDENGNELSTEAVKEKFGEDQYATFKVTVTYPNGENDTREVKVKAGTSEKVGPYYLKQSEKSFNCKISDDQNYDGLIFKVETDEKLSKDLSKDDFELLVNDKTISKEKWRFSSDNEIEIFDEVAANSTVVLKQKVYNSAKYKVEEIETSDNWSITGIENDSGELNAETTTVNVVATNQLKPHYGELNILKTVNYALDEDKVFTFNVAITYSNGKTENDIVQLLVRAGEEAAQYWKYSSDTDWKLIEGNAWSLKKYTWYGDEAPTYTVTETDSQGYRPIINNGTGSLENGKTVTVSALNIKRVEKPVKLTIKKEMKDGIECDEEFTFLVQIKGTRRIIAENIKLKANEEKTYTLLPIPGGQVTYTITEVLPDGSQTELDSMIVSREGEIISDGEGNTSSADLTEYEIPEGSKTYTITGDLTGNEHIMVRAINKVNTENEGAIEVNKSLNKPAECNQKITFKVDVVSEAENITSSPKWENGSKEFEKVIGEDGKTHYIGYPEIIIRKGETENEKPWSSGYFNWLGDVNPTYTIEEVEVVSIDDDGNILDDLTKQYIPTIENAQGELENDQEVTINVTNKKIDKKHGLITIEKKLEEGQKSDEEFTFHLTVRGIKNNQNNENNFHQDIKIKAGSKSTFGFTWTDDTLEEGATEPTFEVYEGTSENSKLTSITATYEDGETLEGVEKIEENKGVRGPLKDGVGITVTAVNELQYSNKIELTKSLSDPASADETFKFNVHVDGYNDVEATITVPKGATEGNVWTSKEYTWYESDGAPTYKIEEIETEDSKKYTPTITPSSGTLDGDKAIIHVDAINTLKSDRGYLSIEKKLSEGTVDNSETFNFRVTVTAADNGKLYNAEDGKTITFDVTGVKAGEKRGPFEFVWEGDAPTYTIEEINIPDGTEVASMESNKDAEVNGNSISGKLVAVEKVENSSEEGVNGTGEEYTDKGAENVTNVTCVTVTNKITAPHSGKITVNKEFEDSKTMPKDDVKEFAEENNVKFNFRLSVKGAFTYDGNTYTNDDELVIVDELTKDNNWKFTTGDIKWYGDTAPTFTIEEIDIPEGWEHVSTVIKPVDSETSTSEGYTLIDGGTREVIITNRPKTIIKLTTKLGGMVWEDGTLDSKGEEGYNAPNGRYDDKYEEKLKDIPVNVYKVIYNSDGSEKTRYFVAETKTQDTKEDIRWDIDEIEVPALTQEDIEAGCTIGENTASYDIEFVYDGQTYEPTDFLVTSNGDARNYRTALTGKASTGENPRRDDYELDSMAVEVSNNSKNITEVKGNLPIDENGDTEGLVKYGTEERNVTYHSNNTGAYPVRSALNTKNSNGEVYEIFKSTATTSAGGLTFPFDRAMNISNKDVDSIIFNGYDNDTDKYIQTANYIAIYNYCLNINLGLVDKADADIALTKNLDNVKVIVKEKMYQYNYSGRYDLTEEKTDTLAKTIKTDGTQTDENINWTLGLYKTDYYYRAEIYNNDSKVYDKLTNFYKNLGKTVEDTEMDVYLTYKIKLKNGSSAYDVVVNSIDDYYDENLTLVTSNETKYLKTKTIGSNGTAKDINGTEIVAYASDYSKKWTDVEKSINGSDGIIYNKMTASELGLELEPNGTKEITMTFKVNKGYDTNSVILGTKCNVAEISSYSTKYHENYSNGAVEHTKGENAGIIDRDSAPGNANIKTHNDKTWYEDDTFAAPMCKIGFVSEDNDRTINGTVWEDKRTETLTNGQIIGDGKYENNEQLVSGLTTELVEKLMIPGEDGNGYIEYDFVWPTDTPLDSLGNKTIKDVSGFKGTISTDDEGNYIFENVAAGDYVVRFTYGDEEIKKAKYTDESPTYYNGQDYKSSIYAAGKEIPNELNIADYLNKEDGDKLNTAVDSEVRRLQVVQNSREITNAIAKVLASASNEDTYAEYRDQLYKDYYMFADTPKLNIDFTNEGTYNINNINFALEERPLTKLSLDKQIEEIKLTTSDGNTIMDAKYDIIYTVDKKGKVKATVTLDEANSYGTDNLQALNRDDATNQGFRYINVDSTILEGATITVKYRFTAINSGEIDTTGDLAYTTVKVDENQYNWNAEGFHAVCESLSDSFAKYNNDKVNTAKYGQYLGNAYYYGTVDDDDEVVASAARQMVDYVDNDMTFSGSLNATGNTSWSNVTELELDGLVDDEILGGGIVDENGVRYEVGNNLIVSVDSNDKNGEFVKDLTPPNAQASMNLTLTKFVAADADDLQIDNIAEIIKYTNTVGRRNILAVTGNTNPAEVYEEFAKDPNSPTDSPYEPDTSVTETITLSPPTGTGLMTWRLQVIGSITAGMAIVAGGIVLIKKKVIK